ncbi:imidazole glycerol phosphate synthase subunit HisH, partial [Candidatus Peregrinibacteria bacterium]|nr:imidazole glycerol phosphate synthase subunit HisH [Candidatus Peregrinibacteria bacterium]
MSASPKVAIIDCGVGNHRSVYNALTLLGVPAEITSDTAAIVAAS